MTTMAIKTTIPAKTIRTHPPLRTPRARATAFRAATLNPFLLLAPFGLAPGAFFGILSLHFTGVMLMARRLGIERAEGGPGPDRPKDDRRDAVVAVDTIVVATTLIG